MKFNIKVALLGLFWLSTVSGAFFYGFTEAAKKQVPQTLDSASAASRPSSKASPPQGDVLTDAERAALEQLRKHGGDDLMSAFADLSDDFLEDIATSETEEGDDAPPPLSSSEALQALLENIESGEYNRGQLWRWLRQIRGPDIPQAVKALDAIARTDRNFRSMTARLIQNLAKEDPTSALMLAYSIEAKTDRSNAVGSVISEWAKGDPYAALDWLGTHTGIDENTVNRATYAIFREIGKRDIAEANALLEGIEDSSTRRRAASGILNSLVNNKNTEPSAIIDFITAQPESMQNGLLSSTLGNSKFRDFDAGISFASSLESSNPELAQQAYQRVASKNARDYPQDTANWALGLDNAQTQQKILGDVMQQWTRYDLVEAGEWLSDAPRNEVYDSAYQNYAQAAAKTDPANAITWAEAITNPSARDATVTWVANAWAKEDPNAAIAYVQSTQYMTPEVREKLIKQLNK
ncbi:MAG: hypothetical protein ACPGN3_04750 [Opitutales bacterium]